MKKHNYPQSLFSNDEVKKILSWTEKLVLNTGTRLTGTAGCRKASEIIYQTLEEVCHSVNQEDFIHHRDAFLSFFKLMTVSYVMALLSWRLLLWYLYPLQRYLNLYSTGSF